MTLNEIERLLTDSGVPDASFDALTLASHFTKRSKASLIADKNTDLASQELDAAAERRAKREPLQYILGEWEFMGLDFEVSPSCLIPRADTELTASLAIDELRGGGRLLDLCTGSGCIAIAVLSYCKDVFCDAVEIDPATAAVAERNGEKNGVSGRLSVITGDVFCSASGDIAKNGKYNVITANPPYITSCEMEALSPELAYEPRLALTDGGDGLSVIRAIIKNYPPMLCDGGKLIIEIGSSQAAAVERIARENSLSCEIRRDLAGRDRAAVIDSHHQSQ